MDEANLALLESWELSLHSHSPRTVRLYLDEARRFVGWLVESGRDADLAAVKTSDVLAWIKALRAKGLAPATVRSRWIALRNLYGWALAEQEIAENPVASIRIAKPNPPAPNVVPRADLKLLLKACEGTDFNARRDLALIRLFIATGLRVSEVCDLTLDDLDLRSRVVHVRHGKGDKARLARIDAATASALDRYKRARARHRLASLGCLWIGHRGPLTRKGVPTILDRRAAQAGIGHVHAHQLRHGFADRWLAAGGNEGDLQKLGGWDGELSMRRYGSARAVDRALAAYDVIDPMGDL